MTATGDAILLHPVGTFSNVTGNRRRIREKIFADMFNGNKSVYAAGDPGSEKTPVVARPTGSFRDATRSRSRVKGEILAAIFKWKSPVEKAAGDRRILLSTAFPNGSLGDSLPRPTG